MEAMASKLSLLQFSAVYLIRRFSARLSNALQGGRGGEFASVGKRAERESDDTRSRRREGYVETERGEGTRVYSRLRSLQRISWSLLDGGLRRCNRTAARRCWWRITLYCRVYCYYCRFLSDPPSISYVRADLSGARGARTGGSGCGADGGVTPGWEGRRSSRYKLEERSSGGGFTDGSALKGDRGVWARGRGKEAEGGSDECRQRERRRSEARGKYWTLT